MLLFLTAWLSFAAFHPMYMSITNMDVDVQQKKMAISVRLFTEDLETVLHAKYGVHGWMGTSNEHRDSRRFLREYLNERFAITVNGNETLVLKTDSMVADGDMMCFHISAQANKNIRSLEVDNRLLTDFFEKQNNLVIVSIGSNERAKRLTRKTHKFEISL